MKSRDSRCRTSPSLPCESLLISKFPNVFLAACGILLMFLSIVARLESIRVLIDESSVHTSSICTSEIIFSSDHPAIISAGQSMPISLKPAESCSAGVLFPCSFPYHCQKSYLLNQSSSWPSAIAIVDATGIVGCSSGCIGSNCEGL